MMTWTIVAIIIAYLIGSLSSAVIVCKLMGLPDPRTQGSGNPGATNVLRVGGKKAAIITLAGDLLKGLIPVLIAKGVGFEHQALAWVMLAAFIGHLYPIFFKFKGGKGVATGIGGLLALNWFIAILAIIIWIIVAVIWRYSSLAAIIAAIFIPILNLFFGEPSYQLALIIMLVFMLWRHRKNLEKLMKGTESKIGSKKNKS